MRVTLVRTILGLTFFAAGLALVVPSLGQTLLNAGRCGDTHGEKTAPNAGNRRRHRLFQQRRYR